MENKYTGEVPLKIGDVQGTLVYDWEAISIMRSTLDDKDLENLVQVDPKKLAIVAAAGFKRHNPELTAEVIIKHSPPIMEVAEAIDRALLFGLHGPENARKILEPLDKMKDDLEAQQEPKKKPPKKTK